MAIIFIIYETNGIINQRNLITGKGVIMEFSVRLKELRVDNDMSQTELAEKLNLKASAISKYEKGITQPSIDTLKSLAEIFSVTVDYLIGMSDIKNPYSNSQITPNEADLIEHFRQLTYENKIRIDERIKTMADA